MIGGVEVKVCGLTRMEDAKNAASIGADFLGFIFHPKSPRNISIEKYRALLPGLPSLPKVAVSVAPSVDLLRKLEELEFDYFQIHYPSGDFPKKTLVEWSERLAPAKLWLAPKVEPGIGFEEDLLPLANTWLWDTYSKDAYGGTGKVGDWKGFKEISNRYPVKNWVLAGGLGPGNVSEAVAATGTKRIDLNSCVEKSPGVKDLKLLEQVKGALNPD